MSSKTQKACTYVRMSVTSVYNEPTFKSFEKQTRGSGIEKENIGLYLE